jgi:hypothetical protein
MVTEKGREFLKDSRKERRYEKEVMMALYEGNCTQTRK